MSNDNLVAEYLKWYRANIDRKVHPSILRGMRNLARKGGLQAHWDRAKLMVRSEKRGK